MSDFVIKFPCGSYHAQDQTGAEYETRSVYAATKFDCRQEADDAAATTGGQVMCVVFGEALGDFLEEVS